MIRLAWLLSLSSLLAISTCDARATVWQLTSATACSWSPLINPDDVLICAIQAAPKTSAKPRKPSKPKSPEPSIWQGPQHCLNSFCVFHNRGHGAGIALVTDADNSERARSILHPPKEIPEISLEDPAFKATHIPGRGTGLIAARRIVAGELVLAEAPTMLIHHGVIEQLTHGPAQENLLTLATQKLPAARRRAVMKMVGVDGGGVGERVLLNSFRVDLPAQDDSQADGQHFGTYPGVARLNHDCRPNLVFHITPGLTHLIRAARDIKAGEELTISYTDVLLPHEDRSTRIASAWLFKCNCRACASPSAAAAADANVRRIQELEARLQDVANNPGSQGIEEMIEELMELYETEGLESKLGGALTVAALNWAMLGKKETAKDFAGRAARHVEWERGGHVQDAKGMRDLESNVEGHWSWRRRLGV